MSIKVLVVDDSLFMRTLISDMLDSDPKIEVVDKAKDGAEAIKKIPKIRPDCITLDLAMPGWDGLTTLKHIMDEYPTPVVILSAYSKKDADITIKCLNTGAVGYVLKPSGELSLDISDVKHQLIEEVKAASKVNVRRIRTLIAKRPIKRARKLAGKNKIVVIGASTGGPQTLELILSLLPIDYAAPIIIVQHVPTRFFTQSIAEHLNQNCELVVKVLENDETIQPGTVYLVPSGFHMKLSPIDKQKVASCLMREKSNILTPSIDRAMKAVAQVYEKNVVGIILSGMGDDGVEGMKAIKEAGGRTIVQDESSMIFGMPRAAMDAGYADKVLPASKITKAMLDMENNDKRL
jgi:two-component system chemotaxis response regulator CheB